MKTRLIALLGAATLAGGVAAADVVRHAEGPLPHASEVKETGAVRELLGLSAEQVNAIAQENQSYREAQRPLGEKIEALHGEMEQAIAAGDKSRLAALLLAQWEANAEIRTASAAHYERVTAILTSAQAEKLRLVRSALRVAAFDPSFLDRSGLGETHVGPERVRHTEDREEETIRHRR